jgi:2-epi-5-epi-valiolone synthase
MTISSGPVTDLRAERISTFRVEVVRRLGESLAEHLAGARRVVAVTDDSPAAVRLRRHLDLMREHEQLDTWRHVPVSALAGLDGLDAVGRLAEEALAAGLGRRDAFVTCHRSWPGHPVPAAAELYRRHTHAVRIVPDLASLLDELGAGNRTEPAGLAVHHRRVIVLVAEDMLDDVATPTELSALHRIAALDDEVAAAARRSTDLSDHRLRRVLAAALPRVLRDHPPGSPTWQARPRLPPSTAVGYQVESVRGVLDPANAALAARLPAGGRVLAVVDAYSPEIVDDLRGYLHHHRDTVRSIDVLPVRATPALKSLAALRPVLAAAERMGLGRDDRIVAVGGGTTLDMVGTAALLHRGQTPYLRIPTTLVGLIDAGVGLKVGVDVARHKNLLGGYHPPLTCLYDSGFLRTLPAAEIRCGLAEAIKIAMVTDRRLFELLDENAADLLSRRDTEPVEEILHRSIAAMMGQLQANPFEEDLRRLPDFGHEFGHALESRSRYRLRHGEAVAIGMALSSHLAVQTGRLDVADHERMTTLLRRIALPITDPLCEPDWLWRVLRVSVTAHKGGSPHLVVPTAVGAGAFIDSIDELTPDMLRHACADLAGRPA